MTLICIVYEDHADAEIATYLADRVIAKSMPWLDVDPNDDLQADDSPLNSLREWIREYKGRRLKWSEMDDLAAEIGLPKLRGFFDGQKGLADARSARRALRIMTQLFGNKGAGVLLRDSDQDESRRAGLEQARLEHSRQPDAFPVVIGVAKAKRECWVLSGFIAKTQAEETILKTERQKLGFNPLTRSEELTAKHDPDHDLRSAKRVLRQFTDTNREREKECWTKTPMNHLRGCGANNGLNEYLDEIERILIPAVRRNE